MKRLHARIEGYVQGVGFRWYTMQHGRNLGLQGWVRNLPDDSVELLAEGSEEKLRQLLTAVRKGPPASRVTTVQETWSEARGNLSGFEAS